MAHGAIWTRRTDYSLMLQRNGMYYYRKVVPEPLRPVSGKREVLTSLKTKDREEAKRKLHRVAAETDRLLDAAWRKHALLAATRKSSSSDGRSRSSGKTNRGALSSARRPRRNLTRKSATLDLGC
jgi:hypothetical protein